MIPETIGFLMIAVMLLAILVGFSISFTLIFLGIVLGAWVFGAKLVFYLMTRQLNDVMLEQTLTAAPGARVSLLHAVDYAPPPYVAVELPADYGSEAWLVDQTRNRLGQWASRLGLSDADQWVRVGFPKNAVIDVAHEEHVDLIVLGTSSADVLKRIVGSTTIGVLQHAPCDVLSVQSTLCAPE